MSDSTIHYRVLRKKTEVPVTGSVKITILRQVEWQLNSEERNHQKLILVSGMLAEKGVTYPVTWKYSTTAADLQNISNALELMDENQPRFDRADVRPEFEMRVEIAPWLLIGSLYVDGKFSNAFADFKQGNEVLRATFDSFDGLRGFRESLS